MKRYLNNIKPCRCTLCGLPIKNKIKNEHLCIKCYGEVMNVKNLQRK